MTLLGVGLALFGPLALAWLGERWNPGPARLLESLLGQGMLVALTGAVLWLGLAHDGLSAAALGFVPLRPQALALGVALGAFFVYGHGPAVYALLRRLRVRRFAGGIGKLAALPVWYLVLAVAIGGTVEEILYRGYAIPRLEQLTGSTALAAVLPVLVFGVAHLPLWGWAPSLSTVFAGAVFTAVFLWQRDLAPLVISHVASDFVGLVLPRLRARR